jgi:hypothetical protein
MTQQLLQISSVFLVQQSELQQVRDRLTKELGRVNGIAEALTFAAQQHQDAVSPRQTLPGSMPAASCQAVNPLLASPTASPTLLSPSRRS